MEEIRKYNRIVIIGEPHVGKTTWFNNLDPKITAGYQLIESDEFIDKYGYVDALYEIIKILKDKYIMEGVLGYRLLRKLAIFNKDDQPDLIIHITSERPYENHAPQVKGLQTIWKEYIECRYGRPREITVEV